MAFLMFMYLVTYSHPQPVRRLAPVVPGSKFCPFYDRVGISPESFLIHDRARSRFNCHFF